MQDLELRHTIHLAILAERPHHLIIQERLREGQRRSKADIEQSRIICAAELPPQVPVPEWATWRMGVYVVPMRSQHKPPASPDLLAAIREIARSG